MLTCSGHPTRMCSRIGASVTRAAGLEEHMVVSSIEEYERRAVSLALRHSYALPPSHLPIPTTVAASSRWHPSNAAGSWPSMPLPPVRRATGPLADIRRWLFLHRYQVPLFDTLRWVRNLEKGLAEAWRRWVFGTEFQLSPEWEECTGPERDSSAIWVTDSAPFLSPE